jgi:hypothetical protein
MSLKSFLRHNSRHCVWFPRGYENRWWPQLNPISSCSHGKNRKRTFYLYEPLRLFRLRQRLFCFAGRQRCGRRDDPFAFNYKDTALPPDTWDYGPDGNRTCSYCGSIHPDDLMAICRKTLTDDRYGIEGTTKSYKVYVRQPGVRNAGEGAIKFYMQHAPKNPRAEDQQLFADACRISSERFMAQFAKRDAAAAR